MKTIKTTLICTVVMIVLSCGNTGKKQHHDESASHTHLPVLTEAEIAEGWALLFDGKTMNGWKIFHDYKNNSWEVKDGALHCKAPNESSTDEENERSDIMTKTQYANFELALEWKISPEANSGIMFRVIEEFPQPYLSGPEFQIIDDVGFPGELKEENKTGANYDMHVATNKILKPVGEWNTARLVVNGDHVEHWLNGSKVLEYELNSEDWTQRMEQSKWREHAGYGQSRQGHIDLQDHGAEAWYRNIKILTL